MGTKRTAEFRQEAVRVALTSGLTRKQVASDFGIGCPGSAPMGSAGSDERWLKRALGAARKRDRSKKTNEGVSQN